MPRHSSRNRPSLDHCRASNFLYPDGGRPIGAADRRTLLTPAHGGTSDCGDRVLGRDHGVHPVFRDRYCLRFRDNAYAMNRRRFFLAATAGALYGRPGGSRPPLQLKEGFITDVEGIKVGHFTETRRPTGCTVILCERGAVAGVDVRGSAPGTRETDLLKPTNTVDKVNAVVLSGGSAFGLDSATGVMRYLEEHDSGYATAAGKVPIVPAAILYDLNVGDGKIRPKAEAGYKACTNAKPGPVDEGSVGAGAGATVGKLGGGKPMKGGIGTSSIKLPNGTVIGAIVAVNCVGDVTDPKTGKIVAGARTPDGKAFLNIMQTYRSGRGVSPNTSPGENTTIGVIATNARFDKTQM